MDDYDINDRMMEIYRRKASMGYGGCNMGSGNYDGMFGGVTSTQAQIVGRYIKRLYREHPKWDRSKIMKEAWKLTKKNKNWRQQSASKPKSKSKSKSKSKPRAYKKSGRRRNPALTVAEKLKKFDMTKDEFYDLTPYQRSKLGKYFHTRTANKICIDPDYDGQFYYNRNLNCVKRKKKT
jgi:hypothetical protein